MHAKKPQESEHAIPSNSQLGAVVLCGGKSSRMGIDKSELLFREKTMLQAVVHQVSVVTPHIVTVGNVDHSDHRIPPHVINAQDKRIGCGAIEGIRVGLEKLAPIVKFAFVTSCDVPLLKPALIRYLFRRIDGHQMAVPVEGKRVYGTAAIYQTDLHEAIGRRIEANQFRVADMASIFDSVRIETRDLQDVDPKLDSLTNINTGNDYLTLLSRFGIECPSVIADRLKETADSLNLASDKKKPRRT